MNSTLDRLEQSPCYYIRLSLRCLSHAARTTVDPTHLIHYIHSFLKMRSRAAFPHSPSSIVPPVASFLDWHDIFSYPLTLTMFGKTVLPQSHLRNAPHTLSRTSPFLFHFRGFHEYHIKLSGLNSNSQQFDSNSAYGSSPSLTVLFQRFL